MKQEMKIKHKILATIKYFILLEFLVVYVGLKMFVFTSAHSHHDGPDQTRPQTSLFGWATYTGNYSVFSHNTLIIHKQNFTLFFYRFFLARLLHVK